VNLVASCLFFLLVGLIYFNFILCENFATFAVNHTNMKIDLTTPALFFSAISLLMLAFTNRFLALAQLVRNLSDQYRDNPTQRVLGQIQNLRTRLHLIRSMQISGILSLLICVMCMFLIYIEKTLLAEFLFGIAMVLLIISLTLSVKEIIISVKALDLHLHDIEEAGKHDGK
jgi:hypothetical protein